MLGRSITFSSVVVASLFGQVYIAMLHIELEVICIIEYFCSFADCNCLLLWLQLMPSSLEALPNASCGTFPTQLHYQFNTFSIFVSNSTDY